MIRKLLLISFLLLACYTYLFPQEKITILHTNDIHGSYLKRLSRNSGNENKTIEYGGIVALNYYVQQIKKEVQGDHLLLDAGDFMTGNPICEIEVEGAKGGALVQFFNYIGYDGLSIGNHEFDISVENCQKLIQLCQFPVVSANLFTTDDHLFAPASHHIYAKGKLKIGVIGIIVHELAEYLNAAQQAKVYSKAPAEIVEEIAEKIDSETDLIIVLSHSGLQNDEALANALSDKVDIIIGAHSHSKINKPKKVNGKIIIQAASNLAFLGRLDVTVAADTVQAYDGDLIFLDATKVLPDLTLKKEIDKYTELIDTQYGMVIGYLKTPWKRNSNGESNIGNFIADCIRENAGADFALINSGGIRKGMKQGEIKKIDVKEILPFENSICVFDVNGQQVMTIVQNNINATANGGFGILQISGLTYRWTVDEYGEIKLIAANIGGKKIEPTRTYKCASIDYILANDEKYLGMKIARFENRYMPIADVVMETIQRKKKIKSKIEGRMVRE